MRGHLQCPKQWVSDSCRCQRVWGACGSVLLGPGGPSATVVLSAPRSPQGTLHPGLELPTGAWQVTPKLWPVPGKSSGILASRGAQHASVTGERGGCVVSASQQLSNSVGDTSFRGLPGVCCLQASVTFHLQTRICEASASSVTRRGRPPLTCLRRK